MDRRRLLVLVALAIVVPAGFLVALKLTGMLDGTVVVAETMTLEPWIWERERPGFLSDFADPRDNISYRNDELFFYYDVCLFDSDSGSTFIGVWNLTVHVKTGFIHDLQLNFSEEYQPSVIDFNHLYRSFAIYHSLTLQEALDEHDPELGSNTKCSLSFVGNGRPTKVTLEYEAVKWSFKSPYNQTHRLEIDARIVYFNGTVYKELIQPLNLKVYSDDNNSFEDADEVIFGTYKGLISERDTVDFYKIQLNNEDAIEITLTIASGDFNLYLYDPNKIEKAKSTSPVPNETEYISYTADEEGYWFIEVRNSGGTGPYTMTIT